MLIQRNKVTLVTNKTKKSYTISISKQKNIILLVALKW
jgi:hypothetical protein